MIKSLFLTLFFLAIVGSVVIMFSSSYTFRWDFGVHKNNNMAGLNGSNARNATDQTGIHKFILNEFSVPNKWCVVLTVNLAYFDMFENWWWHFKKLNIKVNITVIAEDDQSFEKLKKQHDHESITIVRSWILNISKSLKFASAMYNKLGSARPTYMLRYLKEGYNVLYADTDSVWLRNPFTYFKGLSDIWAQTEKNGKRVCAGFIAVRSSTQTIELVKRWEMELKAKSQRNQPVFNELIKQASVNVAPLDEGLFIGGPQASQKTQEQWNHVVMVHATFCLGYEKKLACFKKWNLWFVSRAKKNLA